VPLRSATVANDKMSGKLGALSIFTISSSGQVVSKHGPWRDLRFLPSSETHASYARVLLGMRSEDSQSLKPQQPLQQDNELLAFVRR
jgi:hypothetical protein